jgi:predicted outer membrane repeat protein
VPGETLVDKLAWLRDEALNGGRYLVELVINRQLLNQSQTILPTGRTGVTIILRGTAGDETKLVGTSGSGTFFSITNGLTLVLDENITFFGPNNTNNTSVTMFRVNSGGTLIMNSGSRIINNLPTQGSGTGGGVHVDSGGTFIMNDGVISGNRSRNSTTTAEGRGGGVHVQSGGTFTMRGGIISGNEANRMGNFNSFGGGVFVNGIFNMEGGTISGNTATGSGQGGGIYSNGTVRISNGEISGNTATRGIGGTPGGNQLFRNFGTVQIGTFDANGNFTQTPGSANLTTTDNAIRVVNGVLMEN